MSQPIYLVTGAHGFIGAWVVKKLLAQTARVIIFDKSADPQRLRLIMDDEEIAQAVCRVFSFKPADIIKQLNLLRPIYSKTTNYGHFGKTDPEITWEKTDKVDALRKAVGKSNTVTAASLKKATALVAARAGTVASTRPQVSA